MSAHERKRAYKPKTEAQPNRAPQPDHYHMQMGGVPVPCDCPSTPRPQPPQQMIADKPKPLRVNVEEYRDLKPPLAVFEAWVWGNEEFDATVTFSRRKLFSNMKRVCVTVEEI